MIRSGKDEEGATVKTRTGVGHVLAPWPFIVFGVLAVLVSGVACPFAGLSRGVMIAFDTAAFAFFLMCIRLFSYDAEDMRQAAQRNDANRRVMLLVAAAVTGVILVAVGSELAQKGRPGRFDVALLLLTLICCWCFSTMVYTLHYAHLFYISDEHGNDSGGFAFPHTDEPDYWDFLYQASCLAMTFQTSDVDIQSRICRRAVMFHCLGAFVFNIGVVAFSINILGGS